MVHTPSEAPDLHTVTPSTTRTRLELEKGAKAINDLGIRQRVLAFLDTVPSFTNGRGKEYEVRRLVNAAHNHQNVCEIARLVYPDYPHSNGSDWKSFLGIRRNGTGKSSLPLVSGDGEGI